MNDGPLRSVSGFLILTCETLCVKHVFFACFPFHATGCQSLLVGRTRHPSQPRQMPQSFRACYTNACFMQGVPRALVLLKQHHPRARTHTWHAECVLVLVPESPWYTRPTRPAPVVSCRRVLRVSQAHRLSPPRHIFQVLPEVARPLESGGSVSLTFRRERSKGLPAQSGLGVPERLYLN